MIVMVHIGIVLGIQTVTTVQSMAMPMPTKERLLIKHVVHMVEVVVPLLPLPHVEMAILVMVVVLVIGAAVHGDGVELLLHIAIILPAVDLPVH